MLSKKQPTCPLEPLRDLRCALPVSDPGMIGSEGGPGSGDRSPLHGGLAPHGPT